MILDNSSEADHSPLEVLLVALVAGEQQICDSACALSQRFAMHPEQRAYTTLCDLAIADGERLQRVLPSHLQGPWPLDKAVWGLLRHLEELSIAGAQSGAGSDNAALTLAAMVRLVSYQLSGYQLAEAMPTAAEPRPAVLTTIRHIAEGKRRFIADLHRLLHQRAPQSDQERRDPPQAPHRATTARSDQGS